MFERTFERMSKKRRLQALEAATTRLPDKSALRELHEYSDQELEEMILARGGVLHDALSDAQLEEIARAGRNPAPPAPAPETPSQKGELNDE